MYMWVYAVDYAVLIDRFLPTDTAFGWMTPYEAKYGVVPHVDFFRVFGCVAFIHIDAAVRSQGSKKAYQGFFVGFEAPFVDRVRVFVPELDKVLVSTHVYFDEITKVSRKSPAMLEVVESRFSLSC